jgi:nucleoside-diphosphate-sugar epimerase
MKILVTGGCGYKGNVLVPKLLNLGHEVTVIDTQWFGNFLKPHKNLKVLKADIRNIDEVPMSNLDVVIHLASIANDPCSDLNPKLTWEVSALATMQLADKAQRAGVERFIYASSGSVYGVKVEEKVTEFLELDPISEYNKTKMVAERVLLSYEKDMVIQILRPATVCGLSPRMRLDVAVNMLTMQAIDNGKITVLGGSQIRPNVHIDDITDAYIHLLNNPQYTGIFNIGFENISILDIAQLIKKNFDVEIEITPSNDPRSYRLDSSKFLKTGFKPKKNIDMAVQEIVEAYNSGSIKNLESCYNLQWMKKNGYADDL